MATNKIKNPPIRKENPWPGPWAKSDNNIDKIMRSFTPKQIKEVIFRFLKKPAPHPGLEEVSSKMLKELQKKGQYIYATLHCEYSVG